MPESRPLASYARIYRVVRRIPPGKVATYGQVARLAGLPGQAPGRVFQLSATQGNADPTIDIAGIEINVAG